MRLQWGKITKDVMTYDEALLYCQFCNEGGYTDWRMPTLKEFAAVKPQCRILTWYVDEQRYHNIGRYSVSPVRETITWWQDIISYKRDIRYGISTIINTLFRI